MYGAVLVPDQTQKHDFFKITIVREAVIIVVLGHIPDLFYVGGARLLRMMPLALYNYSILRS